MRSAVVLAGGYSTRFGERDKATADVDGTPMIRHVVARVRDVVDEVVVNCRREQRDALAVALEGIDYRPAVDPVPDEGPVAGMRTGLRVANGDAVAVVACDMPKTDPSLFDRLFEESESTAVPRVDGRLQPLHAVYGRNEARVACDRTLATGSRRLADVLARLDPTVVEVSPDRKSAFTNVNTRSDLERTTGPVADSGSCAPALPDE